MSVLALEFPALFVLVFRQGQIFQSSSASAIRSWSSTVRACMHHIYMLLVRLFALEAATIFTNILPSSSARLFRPQFAWGLFHHMKKLL
jgi:hypothetical protein